MLKMAEAKPDSSLSPLLRIRILLIGCDENAAPRFYFLTYVR